MRKAWLIAVLAWVFAAGSAFAANCTLSGVVLNVDTTPCANCTITLNPYTSQPITPGGNSYTSQPVSTTTDSNGNMTPISLPQGLIVQVTISENGATFGGYTAIVPFIPAATFTQMNQGIGTEPLNVLASLQPPTGPLNMNGQIIQNLACPGTTADALVWGCNATVGNLTVNGTWAVNSGLSVTGGINLSPISDPVAPTVSPIGTTGATSYSYYIVCHTAAGGTTNASPAGSTSIGNNVLNLSNYNQITWVKPTNSTTCDVLRNDLNHAIAYAQPGTTWNDQQNGAGTLYASIARNNTGDLKLNGGNVTGGPGIPLMGSLSIDALAAGKFLRVSGETTNGGYNNEFDVAEAAPLGSIVSMFCQVGSATCVDNTDTVNLAPWDMIDTAVTGSFTFTLRKNALNTSLHCSPTGSSGNQPTSVLAACTYIYQSYVQ